MQKENKAAPSVQGCAVFPGAALCARRRLRCSFEAKALTSLKQVLLFLAAPLKLTTSVAAPETLMHVGAKGDF